MGSRKKENPMKRVLSISTLLLSAVFGLATAQDKGPSDPQIAGIVVAANQIDIDAGKVAKSRSKKKEVKDFAQLMITDHTAVNKQAGALVKKLGVKPEESDTSRSLNSAAKDNLAKLKKLKGAQFDKAYVDHEVDYHQQVLDAIDKVLIPSSKNAELKDLITKVRPAIVAHLDHAKMVQKSLSK
jgi:putative membrane protein